MIIWSFFLRSNMSIDYHPFDGDKFLKFDETFTKLSNIGHILLVNNYLNHSLKSTRELSNCRPLEFILILSPDVYMYTDYSNFAKPLSILKKK